jgi:MoxR-like ATPase
MTAISEAQYQQTGQAWSHSYDVVNRLRYRLRWFVKGRDEVIDLVLIALLADGHVLLEDYPGSGKTTLAKALGDALVPEPESGLPAFQRVQFTPDLLPSDILGFTMFDPEARRFHFQRGPVFTHFLLADEINRTSPKVQAALLEAMGEKQVTIDGITYQMRDPFFVIATQNPLDTAGTFPLPTPQLDRFLFKIRMQHIAREAELDVLRTLHVRQAPPDALEARRLTIHELLAARREVTHSVGVHPLVLETLVNLANLIRAHSRVAQGVSTRSLTQLVPALQARAVLNGRNFVSSEDIEQLAPHALAHRLVCSGGPQDAQTIIAECTRAGIEFLSRQTIAQQPQPAAAYIPNGGYRPPSQ